MPLNLNEFLKEDEVINFGDQKFIVTSNIPPRLLVKTSKFNDLETEEFSEETLDAIYSWIKDMLYVKNEKKDVDSFVEKLNMSQLTQVMTFLSEYLKVGIEDKKKQNSEI